MSKKVSAFTIGFAALVIVVLGAIATAQMSHDNQFPYPKISMHSETSNPSEAPSSPGIPSLPTTDPPPSHTSTKTTPTVTSRPTTSAPPSVIVPPSKTQQPVLPPIPQRAEYQIGGSFAPLSSTTIVMRDRSAQPAQGAYNICYINAFQTQPDETSWWKKEHPTLLLRKNGQVVVDGDWNEALLDISTDAKRRAIADIIGGWVAGCAKSGFHAVEFDNLDSWTRSKGTLTEDDAVRFASLLSSKAHSHRLAAAQKNAVEIVNRRSETKFDFAIAEECQQWNECADYAKAYNNRVIAIEYDKSSFTKACSSWSGSLSIIYRDINVLTRSQGGYQAGAC